jgi:hypothetical protein
VKADQKAVSLRDCAPENPQDIYRKLRNAVVQINSEIILTPLGAPNIPTPEDLTTIFLVGNGFFLCNHAIVCPANLVLIPPEVLATKNRFPYVAVNQPAPSGVTPNTITAVSRILVNVHDVNGCGKSFVYQATLVGVDGAGDVAYLKIDPKLPFNQANPKINKCHPNLDWGESRFLRPGAKIYSIGDLYADRTSPVVPWVSLQPQSAQAGFAEGVLYNERGLDFAGMTPAELLLVSGIPNYKVGAPLIDPFGRVVGMQTFIDQQGIVGGPNEHFMGESLRHFMCETARNVTVIPDANGSFLSYNKSYLGVAWKAVTAQTYSNYLNPVTGFSIPRIDAKTGALDNAPRCKEIIGIQVIAVAGATGFVNLPGASGAPASGGYPALGPVVNSPLLGILTVGDIITHIDDHAVGSELGQGSPGLFTWSHKSGTVVQITYRKSSDAFQGIHKVLITLIAYPPVYDYPYTTIPGFPQGLLPALPYPVRNFSQPV